MSICSMTSKSDKIKNNLSSEPRFVKNCFEGFHIHSKFPITGLKKKKNRLKDKEAASFTDAQKKM